MAGFDYCGLGYSDYCCIRLVKNDSVIEKRSISFNFPARYLKRAAELTFPLVVMQAWSFFGFYSRSLFSYKPKAQISGFLLQ